MLVNYPCMHIWVLAILQLCRLSALYPAWFYFDSRHFNVTCQMVHWLLQFCSLLHNQCAQLLTECFPNIWTGHQLVVFVLSQWWWARCMAFQVEVGAQPWSSWSWLWDYSCHKLVKLNTYLLVFSSLLRHFLPCHQHREARPTFIVAPLFWFAAFLDWLIYHQSSIWLQYHQCQSICKHGWEHHSEQGWG